MTQLDSLRVSQTLDRLMRHWLLAAAMILVAAALALPQLDQYPLSLDSIDSYGFAYGLTESPYTPAHILENLRAEISDQLPFYYILLYLWGAVAGQSLAAARLISLFCGLLSLAMVYRMASDFVSPTAGVIATFILLCSAFYAFYYAQVRYYTLVVLLAALIVWLYLRMTSRRQSAKGRDYLALALACYALVSTHAFGFLLYLALALYHLLAVGKSRRWVLVAASALAGLLLAAPQLYVLLTEGVARAQGIHGGLATGLLNILDTWGVVYSNGFPLLLGLSVVGVAIGWRRNLLRGNPFLLLFPLLLVSIGVASAATGVVSDGQMRYLLVGTPIVVGFIAAGLYALLRLRRWLGLLTLFWLVAGLAFMRAADWEQLIQGRTWAYTHPPWHLISRWMQQSGEDLPVMTFGVSHNGLRKYTFQRAHLMTFYFTQHGIEVNKLTPESLSDFVAPDALQQPGYWTLHQTTHNDPYTNAAIDAEMQSQEYIACDTTHFPNLTVLVTYRWASLHCDTQPKATYDSDAGAYLHYGAVHDENKLLFSGAWQESADSDPDAHNISFQLISSDWGSQAQIDLPTSSLSDMRQFIFELADLPAGDYRLMAVVYDSRTGERLAWQGNEDWIPEMQQLAEIAIPERAAGQNTSN